MPQFIAMVGILAAVSVLAAYLMIRISPGDFPMVRAKLKVTAVTEKEHGGKVIEFTTMYDTSIPEDQRFQKATPWGQFSFQVDNPAASEQLALGKSFYVDFSPAD